MDVILLIMLIVDALLIVGIIITQVRAKKNVIVNEVPDEQVENKVVFASEPVLAFAAATKEDDTSNAEADAVAIDDDKSDTEQETDDLGDLFTSLSANRKPAVPFYTKMLAADESLQRYYNVIRNEFKSYKNINARISKKGDTFRKGRALVAKLTLSGKTIKLYYKLNVADYEESKFHQKFAGDKKTYAEVPMCVKVKSERGLKNAILLIAELMKKEDVAKKQRYTEVDYIDTLKGLEENK